MSVKYVSMCLKRYLYVVYWVLCVDRDSWPATEGSKHSMWYTQDVHVDTCLVNLNTRALSEHRLPASVFWRKSCNVLHMEGIIHDYGSINRKRGRRRICGLTLPPDLLCFRSSFQLLSCLFFFLSSHLLLLCILLIVSEAAIQKHVILVLILACCRTWMSPEMCKWFCFSAPLRFKKLLIDFEKTVSLMVWILRPKFLFDTYISDHFKTRKK